MAGIGQGQVSRDFGGKCEYHGDTVEVKGKVIHNPRTNVSEILSKLTELGDWIEHQGNTQLIFDFDSLVTLTDAQLKVDKPGRGQFYTFTVTVRNDGPNVKEKIAALFNLSERGIPVVLKVADLPEPDATDDDGGEEVADDSSEETEE